MISMNSISMNLGNYNCSQSKAANNTFPGVNEVKGPTSFLDLFNIGLSPKQSRIEVILRGGDSLGRVPNIVFNQGVDLIEPIDKKIYSVTDQVLRSQEKEKYQECKDIISRFGGLCELICNHLLINDELDFHGDRLSFLKSVSLENINSDPILNSHLVKVFSVFHKTVAFISGIYPDNVLSVTDQKKLVKSSIINGVEVRTIDPTVLNTALESIDIGETLKVEVFSWQNFQLTGHSLLVKKTSEDTYTYFDPEFGEYRDMSLDDIVKRLDLSLEVCNGTDVVLMNGSDYLRRLRWHNII